jgi:hypothetical protein
MKEVLGVLERLAYPRDKIEKLSKSCSTELLKGKPSVSGQTEASRKIRSAAKQLATLLSSADGDSKLRLGRVIVKLDDSIDDAHLALEQEKDGTSWVTADDKKCRIRRSEIASTLQIARRLEVEIAVNPSTNPLLLELNGGQGIQATWNNWTLHTPWSAEKTTRVLREVIRASAFSEYLRTGELHLPKNQAKETYVLINSKAMYAKAIEASLRDGGLDAKRAEQSARLADFFDSRGFGLDCSTTEGEALSALLTYSTPLHDGAQSCLTAGHLNWVSMVFFGASLSSWAWTETDAPAGSRPMDQTSVADSEAAKKEREEHLRLARAGIVGCRSYMIYLVQHGQDPPWIHAMVDHKGKVVGEDLLKSTSVIEFLQELGPLAPVLSATDVELNDHPETLFAKALGQSVGVFESRWRAWLVPTPAGIVQRLDQGASKSSGTSHAAPPSEGDALRYLNKLRGQGLAGAVNPLREVSLDASLSDGARLHANYLNMHTDQAAAWPAAHEEYADREGFTSAGAWAGMHSVVHPSAKTPQDAIDGWIGTFYHRLPLLDPGLLAIGWGTVKSCAVMDAGSLCAPAEKAWVVAWPFDGMTGVPIAFCAENPNPVPSEDQSHFGYPVTLQLGLPEEGQAGVEIQMQLFEGKSEVPCYFSSPNHPTNPELVPTNSYCLIPKARLKPKTQYTVQAEWIGTEKKKTWGFKT